MRHSLATAATATGKAKATIHRAIKSGKLSANFNNGVYEIDPAELHRVFAPVSIERTAIQEMRQTDTDSETALFRQEIEFLRQQLEREKELNRDLARRLDDEATERRNLTALLTHQADNKTSNGGELWRRVFKQK
jgi:hypothetical protein